MIRYSPSVLFTTFVCILLYSHHIPISLCLLIFLDQKWEDGEGVSTAAPEEPTVSGAIHLSHPLQHIPTSREEKLLAALLCSLDGAGTGLFCFILFVWGKSSAHWGIIYW